MNFGNIIFIMSLIGGEVVRWLESNWKIVLSVGVVAVLVFLLL
jgi:hypothetical protein